MKKVKFHIDTERSQWPEAEPDPPMELEPGQVIRENGTYGADDPDGNGTIDFTKEQNRSVTGTTNTLGTFVVNVPNGTETKSITSNGTYTPTAPNIGFSQVDVNVQPNLQSKTTTTLGSVTPDNGYTGLSAVTVNSSGSKNIAIKTPGVPSAVEGDIYIAKTNTETLSTGDTIPSTINTYIFMKRFGTITQNGTLDFRYTDPELNETCSLTTYDRYLTINVPQPEKYIYIRFSNNALYDYKINTTPWVYNDTNSNVQITIPANAVYIEGYYQEIEFYAKHSGGTKVIFPGHWFWYGNPPSIGAESDTVGLFATKNRNNSTPTLFFSEFKLPENWSNLTTSNSYTNRVYISTVTGETVLGLFHPELGTSGTDYVNYSDWIQTQS